MSESDGDPIASPAAEPAPVAVPPSTRRLARHVGSRIAVRRLLPEGGVTDLTGELLTVDEAALRLRLPDGTTLALAGSEVTASRVVPPKARRKGPPHRALDIPTLERVAADHWRAPEREHLGEWLLRASGSFTGRANSVLPLGDPGMPLPRAVVAVGRWYAERGMRPMASCPAAVDLSGVPPRDAAVPVAAAEAFTAAGWLVRPGAGALVLTAPVAPLRRAARALDAGLALVSAPTPDEDWLRCYRPDGSATRPEARHLLVSAPEQVFLSIRDGDRTVAVARGSFAQGWTGLYGVRVEETHRRRGLATALLGGVARWGRQRGSSSMLLQVADGNTAATRLYLGLGFSVHHRYDYLAPGS